MDIQEFYRSTGYSKFAFGPCIHFDCTYRNNNGYCTCTACANPKYNGSGTYYTNNTSGDVHGPLRADNKTSPKNKNDP